MCGLWWIEFAFSLLKPFRFSEFALDLLNLHLDFLSLHLDPYVQKKKLSKKGGIFAISLPNTFMNYK